VVWKVSLLQSRFASVAFASTPGLFQGLNLIIEARLDGQLPFQGDRTSPLPVTIDTVSRYAHVIEFGVSGRLPNEHEDPYPAG
jgi:hypothetical protein